jgi:hydroxymethylpyrimidine kinase/phosphomethylpyrimidine kinase
MDPGCGAGLARDILTAAALDAAVRAVGTAWTAQSGEPAAGGVTAIEARQEGALEAAVREAVRRPVGSAFGAGVKIGMVPDATRAAAILRGLERFEGPVVVDPVLAASRGGALWQGEPAELLPLLRRATLATPNAVEAAAVSGLPVTTAGEAAAAAEALCDMGVAAVLVKGGHLTAGDGFAHDLLVTRGGVSTFSHPRVPGPTPRGTGCALATALAVWLARGLTIEAAAERATSWLAGRIRDAIPMGEDLHLP